MTTVHEAIGLTGIVSLLTAVGAIISRINATKVIE